MLIFGLPVYRGMSCLFIIILRRYRSSVHDYVENIIGLLFPLGWEKGHHVASLAFFLRQG